MSFQLEDKILNQIVEDLELGYNVYLHKINKSTISIPKSDDEEELKEYFGEEIKTIKSDKKNYLLIEPLSSKQVFQIMENFVYELEENSSLKNRLLFAFQNKKPFQNFNNIINNDEHYRQDWFKFKTKEFQIKVNEIINSLLL